MLRKIKFALIFAAIVSLCACGYDYDWMKGEFEGTTKLSRKDNYSSSLETIRTGNGRINFATPFYVRLGSNTPLPDCNLKFTSEKELLTYSLDINGVEYQGESNDGKGCGAYLIEGDAVPIEINAASMKYDKGSSEVVLNLKFNIRDDSFRNYEFEFRGRKKGWF